MAIYKLEVFDQDAERLNVGHPNLPMGAHDIGEDLLILTFDFPHWRGSRERVKEQDEYVMKVGERLGKRIMALNFPGAQDAKFLRVTGEIGSLPSKERKSLYSRKLKRRKRDTEDKEETDVKVCKEEEEIPEEKTSTGDEKETVGWRWPH